MRDSIRDTLENLKKKEKDLNASLSTPEITSNIQKLTSLNKELSEISNIVEMIDQSGSDYYYQLLMASQRLGELDQNLDIQLMSYSLSVLANHALDRMLTNRETREALSQTLSEQIEQLLTPHLK